MTDRRRAARPPIGLSAKISGALGSLWSQYAGERPREIRTEIRRDVVTCQLFDAVGAFNRNVIDPQAGGAGRGVGRLTRATYKRDAVAAVVGLTRQRVTSLVSSHDRDTDVATEVFTLEPSLQKGRPRSPASAYR